MTMLLLVPTLLLAIRVPPRQQDETKPAIVSAAQAAREISADLGTNVTVGSGLGQQPVLVVRRGAKAMDIAKGLAFALHASLIDEDGVLRVVRTRADSDALVRLDEKITSDRLRRRLAAWDADLKGASAIGSSAAQVAHYIRTDAAAISAYRQNTAVSLHRDVNPELVSPTGRLLRTLVDRIGLASLSKIQPGAVTVYSDTPTPTEVGIPDCSAAMATFAEEQEAFATDPILKVPDKERRDSLDAFVLPSPDAALAGLRCILTEDRFEDVVDLTAEIYNSQGQLVSTSFLTTRSRDNSLPYQRALIVANRAKESVAALSAEQSAFVSAVKPPMRALPPDDPLWARLLHPESYDPANVLVPTAIKPFVDADARPLIAVIPDDVTLAAMYSAQDGKMNLAAFAALLPDSCEWVEHDGVKILRPLNPNSLEPYNCDRASLGEALLQFREGAQIDLRPWSVLEYEQGLAFQPLPRQIVGIFRHNGMPEFADTNAADDIFQMLGAVPDDQWNELVAGSPLAVSNEDLRSRIWLCLLRSRSGRRPGTAPARHRRSPNRVVARRRARFSPPGRSGER